MNDETYDELLLVIGDYFGIDDDDDDKYDHPNDGIIEEIVGLVDLLEEHYYVVPKDKIHHENKDHLKVLVYGFNEQLKRFKQGDENILDTLRRVLEKQI